MSDEILTKVEEALDQLTLDEQWLVLERLLQRFKHTSQHQKQGQDLYGVWRDIFPPDFDLDAELFEVRHEWEEEWQELRP